MADNELYGSDIISRNKAQFWSEVDFFTVERYRQFGKFINNGTRVLDVGCNTGRGGQVIKELRADVELTGVEIVKERVHKIPTGIYDRIFDLPLEDLRSIEDGYFDIIVAGEVIEHVPKEKFSAFLNACNTLLNNTGTILFTTPNPRAYLVRLGRDKVFKDPSHVNLMTVEELSRYLNESGLALEKILGSGKMTRYLGDQFPLLNVYGSYFAIIKKNA